MSGLLTFLAFPPADICWLAWVGLVPLALALSQLRPAQGFLVGWGFGVVLMAGINSFMGMFGSLPLAAAALAFGLFYGIFGLAVAALGPLKILPLRVAGIAAAWTLTEMARGSAGPIAYTFGHIAYTQHDMLPILQLASLAGAYGVGFFIALVNAALGTLLLAFLPDTWYRPSERTYFIRDAGRTMLGVYVLLFVTYVWGALVIHAVPKPAPDTARLRVAAVQANVSLSTPAQWEEVQEAIDAYIEMSQDLPGDLGLVVWPETAVGLDPGADRSVAQRLRLLARTIGAQMLIGALEVSNGCLYNSAYFLSSRGNVRGTYRKMNLVMFGEYVPMRGRWKFLDRYPIRGQDFSAGTRRVVMDVSGLSLGPLICFEAIFPGPTREVSRLGADVIVILNSDAWAEGTAEVLHNSYTAPLRAVEARRCLVRAASTGISAVYDPYGRPLSDVPAYTKGVAIADVYARHGLSTYHRLGDWPLLSVCILLLLAGLVKACASGRVPHAV